MEISGIELRYALTHQLFLHGPATVAELVELLAAIGFTPTGRPSKEISDALRWEIEHGRVSRTSRGCYAPASMPRSTEYRIVQRVQAMRDSARDEIPALDTFG